MTICAQVSRILLIAHTCTGIVYSHCTHVYSSPVKLSWRHDMNCAGDVARVCRRFGTCTELQPGTPVGVVDSGVIRALTCLCDRGLGRSWTGWRACWAMVGLLGYGVLPIGTCARACAPCCGVPPFRGMFTRVWVCECVRAALLKDRYARCCPVVLRGHVRWNCTCPQALVNVCLRCNTAPAGRMQCMPACVTEECTQTLKEPRNG